MELCVGSRGPGGERRRRPAGGGKNTKRETFRYLHVVGARHMCRVPHTTVSVPVRRYSTEILSILLGVSEQ